MGIFKEWSRTKDTKEIVITCRDGEDNLERLLNAIKSLGNVGHSFSIIVDPDSEPEKFYWDGDGSDSIHSIEVR